MNLKDKYHKHKIYLKKLQINWKILIVFNITEQNI